MPRFLVVVALVVALAPVRPAGDVPALTVTALDVGQGDALLVASPGDGGTRRLLVDAGPYPGGVARSLVTRGVRRLEALAITHAHADHSGGAAEVVRRLQVGALLVGPAHHDARADHSGDARAARAAARGAGTSVVPLHAGQSFRLGDARVRVLWPPRDHVGLSVNDTSLVLRIDGAWGSVLLTGDAEAQAQDALLDRGAPLDVEVLKIPHHGGATNAPDFLARTSPAVAIVSAGADNDYGHPAPSTVRALSRIRTLRTDVHGEVTAVLGPEGVRIGTAGGRDPPG